MHRCSSFYEVGKKDCITSVDQFWPRQDEEGRLIAEDVTAYQKCCIHSVHDQGGNTSNLLSHLKMYYPTLHRFIKSQC